MCMQLLFTKLIYFTDFDTRRLWVKLTIWFRLHLFIFQEVDFPSPLCTPGRGVQCFYKVSSVLRDKIVLTLHPHQDPHQGNGKTQNWSEASERKDAEQFIYCDHVSSPHFLHQVRRETQLGILKLFLEGRDLLFMKTQEKTMPKAVMQRSNLLWLIKELWIEHWEDHSQWGNTLMSENTLIGRQGK